MKKSLSILLSFALVFGLFASMASAADTELTVAQKYQALVDKGVLKGNPDGDARLDANLNRAEFATIAIAISGLAPEKPATATFSDVNSKQWWYGAIEAAAKAGLVEGYNGKFDPKANVTVEQVIKVAVQAADLKIDEKAEAVEGASAWAAPYIKAALDAGLIATGLDYKADATRGQTILVGYSVYEKLNQVEPAKVSVASAKASDYNEVTVTLDKAVDTEKAKLALKRGTGSVATETKWSEDKKSATLTLTSSKITEADYTVTLSGLDAEEIATATASFKGEDEKVAKLDFVTTSDEIAYTTAARVKLRAENQYGKLASFNSANYTVTADAILGATLTKDSEGYLVVRINTAQNSYNKGLTQIPIYVYANENHLTAFKSFKLGFEPFISKAELSEFKYDNGKAAIIGNGDTATAQLSVYDQYGNPVAVSQNLNPVFNNNILPYLQDSKVTVDDYDSDDEYEVRVTLDKKTDKASTHTLTLFVGSATATAKFEVGTSKVATSIEFNGFDGTLAENDADKYVTFNAFDANGDQLTAAEIADNAKNDRFILNGSGVGGTGAKIVTVGPNRGKIHLPSITAVKNSFVFLNLSILSPNANTSKQLQIKVNPERKPASLKVATKAHDKMVLNAESKFVINILDQYGDKYEKALPANYRVSYDFINGSGTGASAVSSGITVTGAIPVAGTGSSVAQSVYSTTTASINGDLFFQATTGSTGRATLKATLEENDTTWKAISSTVAVSIDAIDAQTPLNYSVGDITLYAARDNKALFTGVAAFATADNVAPTSLSTFLPAKEVGLTVKDNAGNSVAVPSLVRNVASSNNNVVNAEADAGRIVGNKAGEATVSVVIAKANGESATLSAKVTVKNDAVIADAITSDGSKNLGTAVNNKFAPVEMAAKVTDNYGVAYEKDAINTYDKLLGVRYTVSELTNVAVTVNAITGEFTGFSVTDTTKPYQFVVTATAPNGKTTSTVFHNQN
ncbi:S-layer homology domain-containing protein [Cohnella phaseoli]|uniref:S-layer family protein n=1 Tax=Cohnella phaseoli TaxID=456490 RepID=A0A3D9KD60_9BACL|nr:S-layer homology domain-containing protein [Cohnella phaseoli]RED84045.1 S-layer family protein [Cohnella phaseoli]